MPYPLILASQSPRRRQLLTEAGYAFQVRPPHPAAECGLCSRETPPQLVGRLAWQKARDVAHQVPYGIIIGCDTVVECQGHILGKPHHRAHAEEMLCLLRGRPHKVYSGLCLWRRPDNQTRAVVDVTQLRMESVSDADLQSYLDSGAWEGKAGALGYQDKLDWLRIEHGSPSNVVGLPLEQLQRLLSDWLGDAYSSLMQCKASSDRR